MVSIIGAKGLESMQVLSAVERRGFIDSMDAQLRNGTPADVPAMMSVGNLCRFAVTIQQWALVLERFVAAGEEIRSTVPEAEWNPAQMMLVALAREAENLLNAPPQVVVPASRQKVILG